MKADVSTFKALNLEERKHLQEWIAAEPSSLGEELLIKYVHKIKQMTAVASQFDPIIKTF